MLYLSRFYRNIFILLGICVLLLCIVILFGG